MGLFLTTIKVDLSAFFYFKITDSADMYQNINVFTIVLFEKKNNFSKNETELRCSVLLMNPAVESIKNLQMESFFYHETVKMTGAIMSVWMFDLKNIYLNELCVSTWRTKLFMIS